VEGTWLYYRAEMQISWQTGFFFVVLLFFLAQDKRSLKYTHTRSLIIIWDKTKLYTQLQEDRKWNNKETYLGRFEGIICGEVNVEKEDSSLVWAFRLEKKITIKWITSISLTQIYPMLHTRLWIWLCWSCQEDHITNMYARTFFSWYLTEYLVSPNQSLPSNSQ
jgi:hypothetical protein